MTTISRPAIDELAASPANSTAANTDGAAKPARRASSRAKIFLALLLLAALASVLDVWLFSPPHVTVVTPAHTVAAGERQVNILTFGDWGGDTRARERNATAMANYVKDSGRPFDATLLLGDNFYTPLKKLDDPQWKRLFEDGYDRKALNMPFYVVMGNHDYKGDSANIQLEYTKAHPESRWKLPQRWYRLDLPADKPLVTFFMLDTNYGEMGKEMWTEECKWFQREIAKPRDTRWTVVGAHHPILTNGREKDTALFLKLWGETLRRHKVDFYLAGHHHNLQHITSPDFETDFIISGGGGKSLAPILRDDRGPFAISAFGFVHVRFGEESADVVYVDQYGRPIHTFSQHPLKKPGEKPTAEPAPEQTEFEMPATDETLEPAHVD